MSRPASVHVRAIMTAITLGGAMTACVAHVPVTSARTASADSIVLERSRCFGACPAYRLTLRADRRISFTPVGRSALTPAEDSSLTRAQFAWLVDAAARSGFFALPPVIAGSRELCPLRATDHPTVTVTIFRPDSAVSVVDYHGCYTDTNLGAAPAVRTLRHFENQIDSIARTKRWLTPAVRRAEPVASGPI